MSWIDRIRDRIYGFDTRSPQPAKRPSPEAAPEPAIPSVFPERVLFVCSGNMCRSAYGEYRFKALISSSHPQTRVISAGTLRITGQPAAAGMIAAAAERGLDLSPHRSNALSGVLVQSADTIFAMEQAHRDALLRIDPQAGSKIVMLGLYLNSPALEIEDPIGREPEVYCRVAAQIDEALGNWIRRCEARLSP